MVDRIRPTEAEFNELKKRRDGAVQKAVAEICERNGWNPSEVQFHVHGSHGCYCDCPDGPCQHDWDGPDWASEDGCAGSVTCSRCGEIAMNHDMRNGP